MLCCMRRTKQVDKQEDTDQKIEQDANKPEDKAHKAATKIQASFRGHIIRKKMKGDKPESDIKANGDAVDNKDEATPETNNTECQENGTQEAPADACLAQEDQQEGDNPRLEEKTSEEKACPDAACTEVEPSLSAASEEKLDLGKTESATEKNSNESLQPSAVNVALSKEECKQADVPGDCETKDAETAKDQAKTEKSAATPVEEKKSDTENTEKVETKKSDAVEETKPNESAQQEEVKGEESKADQESA